MHQLKEVLDQLPAYSFFLLNHQVFGESILNDAVAIVLTTTVLESDLPEMAHLSTIQQVWHGIYRFLVIFLGLSLIHI